MDVVPIDRGDVRRWLGAVAPVIIGGCSPLPPAPPLAASTPLSASLAWPAEQLLPSFPSPSPVQDLIMLQEREQRWEAEGPSLSHKTGRLETDGWPWLQSLGLTWTEVADNWALIAKYRQELGGLIVYDNTQPDTVNLATSLSRSS